MKNFILFLIFIFYTSYTLASENCFIAKENSNILVSEGDCVTRYTPQSSFKIVLSLIGFDSGILKSENEPSWSLSKEKVPYINVCKNDHNPQTWMRDSCLWYSQILTNKLGMKKFQDYITKFSYGNADLSAGLTKSWISSSLKISPDEQTQFLQKIIDHKLSINEESYEETKKIMFIQEMSGGWKLYGKTGFGKQVDKFNKVTLQHGWFVGYLEKGDRSIVFANHLVDHEKKDIFTSLIARNEAFIKLWYLIEELEK